MYRIFQFLLFPILSVLVSQAWGEDADQDSLPDHMEQDAGYIVGIADFIVTAGWHTTCAKLQDTFNCWGENASLAESAPTFSNLRQIAVGSQHICGLDDNGVQCWGDAADGKTTVPPMTGVTQISAYDRHTCAVHEGNVSCWGNNDSGQSSPPTIHQPVVKVAAGGNHTCAMTQFSVYCWGASSQGQLNKPSIYSPTDLAAGYEHNCVIHNAGRAACWGSDGHGQSSPLGFSNAVSIAAGRNMSCAILNSGENYVHCWGGNGNGQINEPVLENPVTLSAGYQHNCALDDRGFHCWGRDHFGQASVPFSLDIDGDGVFDDSDNCRFDMNPVQLDADSDQHGDACDNDDDNDGVFDEADISPLDADLPFSRVSIDGSVDKEYMGAHVAGAGDVNGDGYEDIIGNAFAKFSPPEPGKVKVYSGADGTLLYTLSGSDIEDDYGMAVGGAGDVNNDGYDDFILGAPNQDLGGLNGNEGYAYIYSGKDGNLLRTFVGNHGARLGSDVSAVGDINFDGRADVIVGAHSDDGGGTSAGAAYVYSGSNGEILFEFYGESGSDYFGDSVSGAGDVNADGYNDFVVGENALGSTSKAKVFSGRDGQHLYTFYSNGTGGLRVSDAGDVNADGYADIVIGQWIQFYASRVVSSYTGDVWVYSGREGRLLHHLSGVSVAEKIGLDVAGAGDLNRDGYDDILVGGEDDNNGLDGAGAVSVFSGRDGALLYRFKGDSVGASFGEAVDSWGGEGYKAVGLIAGAFRHDVGGDTVGRMTSIRLALDTDIDGMTNSWEELHGLDVNDAGDAEIDNDSDTLSNLEEFLLHTDPAVADTDGDSVNDGDDIFPLDSTESQDVDGDGVGNNGDNCTFLSNPGQSDWNADGAGDSCSMVPLPLDKDFKGLLLKTGS